MMQKKSFSLAGHKTSIALEGAFWRALEGIACTRGLTLSQLVLDIDARRLNDNPPPNLASALRLFCLENKDEAASLKD